MDWKSATVKGDGTYAIPKRWLLLHYYEALNLLFRIENALRIFVYVTLKNDRLDKWADAAIQTSEEQQSTINGAAQKRIKQARGFGYLGYEIDSPLMHLNSGELTRLITSDAYWPLFEPYFKGKKEIIRTKLEEIGIVRNSLAHFRPIRQDDIELIKQNSKHALVGIEECLAEMTQTNYVVPTNTTTAWYTQLIGLREVASPICKLQCYQSKNEQWIRVETNYACPVPEQTKHWDEFISYKVLNLISPAIVRNFPEIAKHCTFLMEYVPYTTMQDDGIPDYSKNVSIIFARKMIEKHHTLIRC